MLQERHLAAGVVERLGVFVVARRGAGEWNERHGGRLGAAVLARDASEAVVGAGCGSGMATPWRSALRRSSSAIVTARRCSSADVDAAPFFQADFLVERVLELVRGALEFSQALPQRFAELGQLARPENNQGNREDNDEFGDPDRAKHIRGLYPRKVCYHPIYAYSPVFLGGGPGRPAVGAGGRLFRQFRAGHAGPGFPAIPGIYGRPGRHRPRVRRAGRFRSPDLRRGRRDAPDPRPAFELFRPPPVRADARAAGGQVLRRRPLNPGDRRRHHRHVALRRVARLQAPASAAATSSRASRARTPRAGRPSRPPSS